MNTLTKPKISLDFLKKMGIKQSNHGTSTGQNTEGSRKSIKSFSPVDGELIGSVSVTTKEQYEDVMNKAQAAFKIWREVPAPKRGEIVRQYGEELRKH